MAACDNLYGNKKEWVELRDFLFENYPKAVWYMKPKPQLEDVHVRICYIPEIQEYLIENCPLVWVQERINQNFDIQRMICGNAHHERGIETNTVESKALRKCRMPIRKKLSEKLTHKELRTDILGE